MRKNIFSAALALIMISALLVSCSAVRPADESITENDTSAVSADDTTEEETEAQTESVTTAEETTAPETAPSVTTAPETAATPVTPTPAVGSQYPTILTYHLILDEPYTQFTNLFVPVADFESQLKNLNSAGYKYLFADQFGEVSEKSVILTFDDGYEDNYTNMFPLLKKYNARATVFMIAYKINTKGYLTSDQIKEMADSGLVQFGSHTSSHYDLRGMGTDKLREELGGSKSMLSNLTGQSVNCICYPAGGYDSATLAVAKEYYKFGFTTHSGRYKGEDMLELPRVAVQRGTTGQGLLWTLGG